MNCRCIYRSCPARGRSRRTGREEPVEKSHEFVGRQGFRDPREAPDVQEHDRHPPRLAAELERTRRFLELFDKLRHEILAERLPDEALLAVAREIENGEDAHEDRPRAQRGNERLQQQAGVAEGEPRSAEDEQHDGRDDREGERCVEPREENDDDEAERDGGDDLKPLRPVRAAMNPPAESAPPLGRESRRQAQSRRAGSPEDRAGQPRTFQ